MKEIARMIYDTVIVLSACILLWILVSWVDVVANNSPYQDRQPHSWNAFVILTEMEP